MAFNDFTADRKSESGNLSALIGRIKRFKNKLPFIRRNAFAVIGDYNIYAVPFFGKGNPDDLAFAFNMLEAVAYDISENAVEFRSVNRYTGFLGVVDQFKSYA